MAKKNFVKKNKTQIIAEPGRLEVLITREFDAPREIVFNTFIDPDLHVQWLGPRELKLILLEFDPKSGGKYRYINEDPEGNQYVFHGMYHEILPLKESLIHLNLKDFLNRATLALKPQHSKALTGDRTKMTTQAIFQSVADRDGIIQSGMERGVNDSHERLEELLNKLKKQ